MGSSAPPPRGRITGPSASIAIASRSPWSRSASPPRAVAERGRPEHHPVGPRLEERVDLPLGGDAAARLHRDAEAGDRPRRPRGSRARREGRGRRRRRVGAARPPRRTVGRGQRIAAERVDGLGADGAIRTSRPPETSIAGMTSKLIRGLRPASARARRPLSAGVSTTFADPGPRRSRSSESRPAPGSTRKLPTSSGLTPSEARNRTFTGRARRAHRGAASASR